MPGQAHPEWALKERAKADLAAFIEAGVALNGYDSSAWLPALDIPAAVLVTLRDTDRRPVAPGGDGGPHPGSRRYEVAAGHDAVVTSPTSFLPTLQAACAELIG